MTDYIKKAEELGKCPHGNPREFSTAYMEDEEGKCRLCRKDAVKCECGSCSDQVAAFKPREVRVLSVEEVKDLLEEWQVNRDDTLDIAKAIHEAIYGGGK